MFCHKCPSEFSGAYSQIKFNLHKFFSLVVWGKELKKVTLKYEMLMGLGKF